MHRPLVDGRLRSGLGPLQARAPRLFFNWERVGSARFTSQDTAQATSKVAAPDSPRPRPPRTRSRDQPGMSVPGPRRALPCRRWCPGLPLTAASLTSAGLPWGPAVLAVPAVAELQLGPVPCCLRPVGGHFLGFPPPHCPPSLRGCTASLGASPGRGRARARLWWWAGRPGPLGAAGGLLGHPGGDAQLHVVSPVLRGPRLVEGVREAGLEGRSASGTLVAGHRLSASNTSSLWRHMCAQSLPGPVSPPRPGSPRLHLWRVPGRYMHTTQSLDLGRPRLGTGCMKRWGHGVGSPGFSPLPASGDHPTSGG